MAGLEVEPSPAIFCSPQARHRTRLQGFWVGYCLQRARRRSIGFVIGPQGLRVRAPAGIGLRDIELALQSKAGWIVRKLHEQRQRASQRGAACVGWRHGAEFALLGEPVSIVLTACADGVALSADRRALHVGLPLHAAPQQIGDKVLGWLRRHAQQLFEARCRYFEPQLGVRVRRLALSSARTRWGSASADGSVRLNWRLVHCALSTIDYVVVHELAHLREMHHGPAFWQLVRAVLPDFERSRDALRRCSLPVFEGADLA